MRWPLGKDAGSAATLRDIDALVKQGLSKEAESMTKAYIIAQATVTDPGQYEGLGAAK
jgi:hypothetical protein